MITVRDNVVINADRKSVFQCLWDPTLWTHITPHVKTINMLEESEGYQRFEMHIQGGEELYIVETERKADCFKRISYEQIKPPSVLKSHAGRWTLKDVDNGTAVDLVHQAVVDFKAAEVMWEGKDQEEIRHIVADTLRRNGRTTLEAVKQHLESMPAAAPVRFE